ncbi:MAG: DUF4838 domain-containing protein [Acidobacteria bacterium]|nr:DUF4838 domain-containing protein [Acidobacteriota bacterium]
MILLLLTALLLAGPLSAITLVKDGRSSYSIVLSTAATPSMQRGARELQHFLEQMSGAKLPIAAQASSDAIVLEAAESLGPEGYRIRTQGRNLVIAGGAQRGVMYGVYTLLERLGCRWFSPEVSRIPRMRTIEWKLPEETGKPAFEYREPFFTEAFDKDWAARNKTNGAHSKLDESTGGKLNYHPFVHSFYEMIPPQKHFQEHPEYFSLIDGKRRWERGQLCLTNPDVVRLGIEAVERWTREHPEATIYSVSQNDWTGWCECDNCQRVEREEGGVHSGPLLRYVNAVAEDVGKRHPDKLIDTLAYWYTEAPPEKVRPVKNVRIRLCPIGVCQAHPYEKCPHSAYFVNNLRAWAKITQQLYIWHYNTNFSHYLLPFPDFDELAADIPLYARSGVVGLFMEGAYAAGGGGENAELRSYVMAKQMWDPRVNVDATVNEFLTGVYGSAAKRMREYYDLMQAQVRPSPKGRGNHLWIFIHPNSPYLLGDFVPRAKEIFRKAEAEAGDEAVRRRVRKARLSIDYVELLRAKTFEAGADTYAPRDLPMLKDRFASFLATARAFGITRFHENRGLAEDEKEYAAMIRPYPLVRLENARLRVELVPELAGRVVAMFDKEARASLLRVADPGEGGYPGVAGLSAWIYPDYHTRNSLDVQWEVVRSSATSVELRGTSAGVSVRRALTLERDTLRTATEAVNAGTEPRRLAIQARADYGPNLPADPRLVYGWGSVERTPIVAGKETSSSENPKVAELNGSWWTGHAGSPVRLVNSFEPGEVPRASLSWTVRGDSKFTLTLWSQERELPPGGTLRLRADYHVVRRK